MRLLTVDISNFRSIDDLKFPFDHGCQALIGINESGKSNILRALHLLDPTVSTSPGDLRIERYDEPQVKSGYVRFVFELSKPEIDLVWEGVSSHFCTTSINDPVLIDGVVERTMKQWCLSHREGLHRVILPGGGRSNTTWSPKLSERVAEHWYRNRSSESITLPLPGSTAAVVPARGFFRAPPEMSLAESTFEKATLKDITALHTDLVSKHVAANLPKCIFWKYADQYLLPSSIDVASFCAKPDTCIPLKSMFELAGYDAATLGTTLTQAQAQGHHRYVQILEKTASKASDHIRQVWKDYKSVRIRLESHGATLSPVVVDDVVPLDMVNRSDGFKRFVSFLLQVSAKVRTEELKDTLILIDEPEIALHPSGARNLMRELIEIGKTNIVVYSTHSIFMVDKNEIGRHLVVEKKKEVTATWRAERSRIQDEEVLYSAMGYSIFETLKEHNVIFEGWRDKELFRVVAEAMGKADAAIKTRLAGIGMTFAEGVKDVRNVAHFLQLASRACLIISDADKPALQHQKTYRTPGAWGKWKTLKEALPGTTALTGEDFVIRAAVVKRANKFRSAVPNLGALTEEFFNAGEGTVPGMRRWLETSGLLGTHLDESLNDLKGAIFEGLKRNEISDEAEGLVKFVVDYNFDVAQAN